MNTYGLLNRFKQNRKRARIPQKGVADAMNKRHGTKYTKSAICNYESGNTPASIDRLISLLQCTGAEVEIMVKESINSKFSICIDKMAEDDKIRLMSFIKNLHRESFQRFLQSDDRTMEDLECCLYLSNYINRWVQVVPKKNGVTFLMLEKEVNGRYDYIYK